MIDINIGKFRTNIELSINFLTKLNLNKEINRIKICNPNFKSKYSKSFLDLIYNDNYKLVYDTAISNGDYDILLTDDSFFQFSYLKSEDRFVIKYSYYPNPYNFQSFLQFKSNLIKENVISEEEQNDDYTIDCLYEQYKIEADLKKEIISMRYDYDEFEYSELCHPISHLHIGLYDETRIPINYVMLPELFVQNVVMLIYSKEWKTAVENEQIKAMCFDGKKRAIRCSGSELLNSVEKKILYIN